MNKPQAEGKVNHVCTEEHRRSSTLFSNKKKWSTIVSLSKVIFLQKSNHTVWGLCRKSMDRREASLRCNFTCGCHCWTVLLYKTVLKLTVNVIFSHICAVLFLQYRLFSHSILRRGDTASLASSEETPLAKHEPLPNLCSLLKILFI